MKEKRITGTIEEDLYRELKKILKENGMTINGWIYVKAKEEVNKNK